MDSSLSFCRQRTRERACHHRQACFIDAEAIAVCVCVCVCVHVRVTCLLFSTIPSEGFILPLEHCPEFIERSSVQVCVCVCVCRYPEQMYVLHCERVGYGMQLFRVSPHTHTHLKHPPAPSIP